MWKTHSWKCCLLGGPLYFLSELRKRFIDTLNLTDEQIIFPENSQLIVAIGAAIAAEDEDCVKFSTIISNLKILLMLPMKQTG